MSFSLLLLVVIFVVCSPSCVRSEEEGARGGKKHAHWSIIPALPGLVSNDCEYKYLQSVS